MKIKRSYLQLLLGPLAAALVLANCTVKEGSDGDSCTKGDKDSGCECPGGAVGYQVCNSQGVYGSCVCPGTSGDGTSGSTGSSGSGAGTTNGTAGKTGTSQGGSGNGSQAGAGNDTTEGGADNAGGSGEGGAGGAGVAIDPDDCYSCLAVQCPQELDACLNDPTCISADADGTGQYERISTCIEAERASGLVKRDVVRGCGVTIGASPDPDVISAWAPVGMAATTTNLMNCMATSGSETPNADWANSDANFPVDAQNNVKPTAWPADSCAKLSCTSKH